MTPIGIDLGTTNSCVAVVEGNTAVVLDQSFGLPTMPSVIAEDREGQLLIGLDALNVQHPLHRYGFVKRHMATRATFAFGSPGEEVTRDAAWISGQYLRVLRDKAVQALDDEVSAVVTVPAHFDQRDRQQVRDACAGAGLDLIVLLEEPIAAGLAFHSFQRSLSRTEAGHVLVFDLGGGTLDTTLCTVNRGRMEVVSLAGDKYLGGLEFDKALVQMAANQLREQGIGLPATGSMNEGMSRSSWLWDLLCGAERCKKRLSNDDEVHWQEDLMVAGRRAFIDLRVRREVFEAAIGQHLQRCFGYADATLLGGDEPATADPKRLREAVSQLDCILLVGGSTKVPAIAAGLRDHYLTRTGIDVDIQSHRPDECVAIGAALHARQRSKRRAHSLGGARISFPVPPLAEVNASVSELPRLHGRVSGAGPGSSLALLSPAGESTLELDGGRFLVPPLALEPGLNTFTLVLREGGADVDRVEIAVERGRGIIDVAATGLTAPISLRLVDGHRELLAKSTPEGTWSTLELYTNDDHPTLRAPLYEGDHPVGTLEVRSAGRAGALVRISGACIGAALSLRLEVDGEVAEHTLELEPMRMGEGRSALDKRRLELVRQAEDTLSEHRANGGPVYEHLRLALEWLAIELQLEFENPAGDDGRITALLLRLERLCDELARYTLSAEGLTRRIESTLEATERNDDTDLADRLRALLPPLQQGTPDRDLLEDTNTQLTSIQRESFRRHPVSLEATDVAARIDEIRQRIVAIQTHAPDPQIQKRARTAEQVLSQLERSGRTLDERWHRLWLLDQENVAPLFYQVVIRARQAGLLRSAR